MDRKKDRPQNRNEEQVDQEGQSGYQGSDSNGSQDEKRNERRFGWSDFEEG